MNNQHVLLNKRLKFKVDGGYGMSGVSVCLHVCVRVWYLP